MRTVVSYVGGRFGNILFAVATGKYLASKYNASYLATWNGDLTAESYNYDQAGTNYYKDIVPYFSNIDLFYQKNIFDLYKNYTRYNEQLSSLYMPIMPDDSDVIVINGCRHSPKYWDNDKQFALDLFKSKIDSYIYMNILKSYIMISICIV